MNEREIYISKGYSSLLKDPFYHDGFYVSKYRAYSSKRSSFIFKEPFNFLNSKNLPSWQITQWMSDHIINPLDDNSYVHLVDQTKHTIYHGKDPINESTKIISFDTSNGETYLECNCEKEYQETSKNINSQHYWWVHLLLEQDFSKNLLYLRDLKELFIEMNFKITKCIKINDEISNCAQMNMFITVQNRNKRSKEYGKYMWYGFNLFDNRHIGKVLPASSTYEYGSNVFLRIIGSEECLNIKHMPDVNEEAKCHLDMLEDIKKTFLEAKKANYFKDTKFEDLAIGGLNFGFEVPGIYNIGCQFNNVDLYYKKKRK